MDTIYTQLVATNPADALAGGHFVAALPAAPIFCTGSFASISTLAVGGRIGLSWLATWRCRPFAPWQKLATAAFCGLLPAGNVGRGAILELATGLGSTAFFGILSLAFR